MNDQETIRQQLAPYLIAAEDGSLSDSMRDEFATLLKQSSAAREYVARYMATAALIEWESSPDHDEACGASDRDDQMSADVAQPAPTTPAVSQSWPQRVLRHDFRVGIVAATLTTVAVVAWAAMTYLPGTAKKDEQDDGKSKHVAVLTERDRVAWLDGTRPAPNRPQLMAGQRLAIESGQIQITYRTGAIVVIEGPAEFVVGSQASGDQAVRHQEDNSRGREPADAKNSGFLKLGSLVARCETRASKGFTIATPNARIEDLGTEFGVNVGQHGAAEVVVLSGEVDLVRTSLGDQSAERVRLTRGQGATVEAKSGAIARHGKVDEQTIAEMKSRLKSIRTVPATTDSTAGATLIGHWTFDDGSGTTRCTTHLWT